MLSRRAVKEEEGGGFLLFFSYLFIKFLPFFFFEMGSVSLVAAMG